MINHHYHLAPQRLEALFASRPIRAVVLTTPANPTGAVFPPETLERIARLCKAHHAWCGRRGVLSLGRGLVVRGRRNWGS
jgi:aspartate/methionine/tyrosine aminotransferase